MGCPLDCLPSSLEILKPAVGGRFVAHTPPDALLGIQRRLIGRQVIQRKSAVGAQELSDDFALMPAGAIDVQPNPITLEPSVQVPEYHQETLAVPLGSSHQTIPPQKRSHPPREVEPLVMLAGRGNPQTLPLWGPPSSQARMQGKARLILKD